MSLRLENLVKPFTLMSEDEQLALIREVRRKRFFVRETKAKVKQKRTEVKERKRSGTAGRAALRKLLEAMSPEERVAFLEQATTGEASDN